MYFRKFVVGEMANNNYLLIDNHEAALIDCTGDIPELDSVLNENNAELKYILLTHSHFDHIAGVKKIQDKYNVTVCIHEADKKSLETTNDFMYAVGLPAIDIPSVDRLLHDGDKISLGNVDIEVIHLPGHTLGGVGYKVDNMIFSGDTVFLGSVGRTDLPGGDYSTIVDTVKNKIFMLDDKTILYPGHGADTTVEYEKKYNIILDN